MDANVLGGRFILAIKNVGSPDEMAKAREIAQGHKEKDKPYMVHETATLRSTSVGLIFSMAAMNGFRISLHDVNQAYIQAKNKLTRQIFTPPKKEHLEIPWISQEEMLELLPLYGIRDAGDCWGATVEYHVEDELNMKLSLADPDIYLKI